ALAKVLRKPAKAYRDWLQTAAKGFERFWNEEKGYCFDVLDGPAGNDDSLRPNQIFSVALPQSARTKEQQRRIVDVCAKRLLTPAGLRSLAQDHPDYRGRCTGP